MNWPTSSHNDDPTNAGERSPTNEGPPALNYQSFHDSVETTRDFISQTKYRGFSSSINDMFADAESERVDCCALVCCGIFQSDRNRYLVSGIKAPSFCKRFCIHIAFPVCIFFLAMLCAVKIDDPLFSRMFGTGLMVLLLAYFIIQCMKGMWKRREIRKDLLWSKSEMQRTGNFRSRQDEDATVDGSVAEAPGYFMGQTHSDIRNAHSICGCYTNDGNENDSQSARSNNFCSRLFQGYTNACCGVLWGCNLQLCGICGLAQEGRELEKLMQRQYRRVDYVTMQPMLDYYPAIYEARNNPNDGFLTNPRVSLGRLSNFSKWVLGIVVAALVLLLVWSFLGLDFGIKNYAVFCATLFQAFFVMKIVHWNHTRDISTDALIKFFVSGFCLSTILAVVFEVLVGLCMRLVMFILMQISGINVVNASGYSAHGFMIGPGFSSILEMSEVEDESTTYKDYLKAYGNDHPFIYTIYLFVNAFLLAATIEETCKYFGFRMIDHPDFLSQKEVVDAAKVEEHQGEVSESASHFTHQDRILESRGAAITVAMVATALGFACCENLIYIFIYGSSDFNVEVVILIARSIFPVHPIAAALQSISVCERDLLKNPDMSLGRILSRGILFHGIYDFLLMWIDFLYSRKANYVDDDDDAVIEPDDESDWLSFILSICVLIFALWYFFSASYLQRARFQSIDRESALGLSTLS